MTDATSKENQHFRMVIELTGKIEDRGVMAWGTVESGSLKKDQTVLVLSKGKLLRPFVTYVQASCGPHTRYVNMAMLWLKDIQPEDLEIGMILTTEDL